MERADLLLAKMGLYESRARAQSAIKLGLVIVDGRVIKKSSEKISENSIIEAKKEFPWVSRGGVKLEHALKQFNISVKNKVCLDVGASTGGFTEVLYSNGAKKIYSVDVGRDQLHHRLKNIEKIVSMENFDARNLTEKVAAKTFGADSDHTVKATFVLMVPISWVCLELSFAPY